MIVLLAPQQDRSDVIIPNGPCRPLVLLSRGRKQDSPHQPFLGAIWSRDRTIVAGMSPFGEVARHTRTYEFHSCALCREVSRRDLSTKIPSLPLVLAIAHLHALPKITGYSWVSEHWHIGVFKKFPFRDHGTIKHTQCYIGFTKAIPCINLLFSPYVNCEYPCGTWPSWPAAVYCRSL